MTKKDQLLKELEGLPEEALEKILGYVKEIKEEGKEKQLPEKYEEICEGAPNGWIKKYYGVIKTKIQNPLKWQRQIRDEWED